MSTLLGNGNEDDDVLFFSKVDDFFDGGGFGVLGYFPRRVSSRAPLSVFFFFFFSEDEDKKVGREKGSVEKVVVFVVLSKMMRRLMCGVKEEEKKRKDSYSQNKQKGRRGRFFLFSLQNSLGLHILYRVYSRHCFFVQYFLVGKKEEHFGGLSLHLVVLYIHISKDA